MLDKRDYKLMETLDLRLVHVIVEASTVSTIPFTVIETSREISKQRDLLLQGRTKTLESKHLIKPYAMAADLAPIHIDSFHRRLIPWPKEPKENETPEETIKRLTENIKRYAYFYSMIGCIMSVAKKISHGKKWHIRSGADWNNNGSYFDNSFDDLVHFEIVEHE